MKLKPLFAIFTTCLLLALGSPAFAQESTLIATVNDHPVTTFDIDQRIKLLEILGQKGGFDREKDRAWWNVHQHWHDSIKDSSGGCD